MVQTLRGNILHYFSLCAFELVGWINLNRQVRKKMIWIHSLVQLPGKIQDT